MTIEINDWFVAGILGGVAVAFGVRLVLDAYDHWWVERELRRRDREEWKP